MKLLTGASNSIRDISLASGGIAPFESESLGAVIVPSWRLLVHARYCDDVQNRRPKRKADWTLHCLYNIDKNPEQNILLTEEEPKKAEELGRLWKYFMSRRNNGGMDVELDPKFIEELRKSGYDFR